MNKNVNFFYKMPKLINIGIEETQGVAPCIYSLCERILAVNSIAFVNVPVNVKTSPFL